MGKIERVPFALSGTDDTVEMMTECGVAEFDVCEDGGTRVMGTPEKVPGKIIASLDRGLFAMYANGKDVMVSVRLDEAKEVIDSAYQADCISSVEK